MAEMMLVKEELIKIREKLTKIREETITKNKIKFETLWKTYTGLLPKDKHRVDFLKENICYWVQVFEMETLPMIIPQQKSIHDVYPTKYRIIISWSNVKNKHKRMVMKMGVFNNVIYCE